MNDVLFDEISGLIYAKFGIVLGVRDREKLRRFWREYNLPESIESIEMILGNTELLHKLLDAITVGETFFFRHESQFLVLEKLMVDLGKKYKELRIWSAGCSTGEEPYSIAIVAYKVFGEDAKNRVVIIANDINREAIEKALMGVYGRHSFRACSKDIIDNFFNKIDDDTYEVKDHIKKLVKFYVFSLTSQEDVRRYVGMLTCHIIFCRNVIIYFDESSRRVAVNNFYDALVPGGYIFLAPTETIRDLSQGRFEFVISTGGIFYVKK